MLFLCIFSFCVFALLLWNKFRDSNSLPPGPLKLPIIGNLLQLGYMKKKLGFHHLVWKSLVEAYGPIVSVKMGRPNIVIVSDLSFIKEVGLNEDLQGRPDGFFYRKRALGIRGGLAFSEGPIWAEQRRFCLSHLRSLSLGQNLKEQLINEQAESLIEWIGSFDGRPMYIESIFNRFLVNIIWNFTAGKRYHRDDSRLVHISDVIDKSFRRMNISGSLLNQLPELRFIVPILSGYMEYCKLQNKIVKFIKDEIQEHKLSYNAKKMDNLIDVILHEMYRHDKSAHFTEADLYVICLDLLLAGTDTTSNTLSFIIVYLMYHQDVQHKVHAEIDNIIGNNRRAALTDKNRMPYLSAVICEVQRIANIAPGGIPHRSTKQTTIGPYTIPKDTIIIAFLYKIHRNEKWIDPDNFRPERFLNKEGKLFNIETFLPFGFGKRRCIGESLAKANIFLFCCNIFQHFHLIPSSDAPASIELIDGITLLPKPFNAIWKKRKTLFKN